MAADGQNAAAAALRWRCVGAARYVVALAMTALVVTVVVHAVHVLLRPVDMFLRVQRGFIDVRVLQGRPPDSDLRFSLDLEVANPREVGAIFFEDVNAYLYGRVNDESEPGYFVTIPLLDVALKQQTSTNFLGQRAYPDLTLPDYKAYGDLFHNSGNQGISNGIVTVNGTLTIGLYSGRNQTPKAATYYCWPVVIGGDLPEDTEGGGMCVDNPPTPEATLPES